MDTRRRGTTRPGCPPLCFFEKLNFGNWEEQHDGYERISRNERGQRMSNWLSLVQPASAPLSLIGVPKKRKEC